MHGVLVSILLGQAQSSFEMPFKWVSWLMHELIKAETILSEAIQVGFLVDELIKAETILYDNIPCLDQ